MGMRVVATGSEEGVLRIGPASGGEPHLFFGQMGSEKSRQRVAPGPIPRGIGRVSRPARPTWTMRARSGTPWPAASNARFGARRTRATWPGPPAAIWLPLPDAWLLLPRSFYVFDLEAPQGADPLALLNDEIEFRTVGRLAWAEGLIGAVSFTPDGRLVSTSDEAVVWLWHLLTKPDGPVRELRSQRGRNRWEGAWTSLPIGSPWSWSARRARLSPSRSMDREAPSMTRAV
jgi:hypothetical protein